MANVSCLCLGPRNSGKTHLLNSLQQPGSINNVSQFVPTVGTNIFRIKLTPKMDGKLSGSEAISGATCSKQKKVAATVSRQSKNQRLSEISVLEIGGEMAPMWTNYLSNVGKIIYVVDTSNLCQISSAGKQVMRYDDETKQNPFSVCHSGVLLYSLLTDPRLKRAKFLLVLTKMDFAYRQMRNEALLMLQFEKLRKQISQPIEVVEASAVTCTGLEHIFEWLSIQ